MLRKLLPLTASAPCFAEFLGDCVKVVNVIPSRSYGRLDGFTAVARVYFGTAWQILAGITWHSLPLEFIGKVYFNSQS